MIQKSDKMATSSPDLVAEISDALLCARSVGGFYCIHLFLVSCPIGSRPLAYGWVTERLHIVTLSVPPETPLFGRPAPSGRQRVDFDGHVVRTVAKYMP